MYEPRTYRKQFNRERFYAFEALFRETDLWVGVDTDSYTTGIKSLALKKVASVRKVLDDYIAGHPNFRKTLHPVHPDVGAAPEINEMISVSAKAGIGPMSAVAGLFAQETGKNIIENHDLQELIIENGGDIFLKLKNDLILSVFAGKSALSEKIGVVIPANETPLGVCTSAGTVGPSKSFGKADAVMVACKSATLADALATALGNKVKSATNIDAVLNYSEKYPEILSVVIICEGKVGIRGNFEVKILKGG